MVYNLTFVLRSLFFFFLKLWSEIGVRIIHRRTLYTGKYGKVLNSQRFFVFETVQGSTASGHWGSLPSQLKLIDSTVKRLPTNPVVI